MAAKIFRINYKSDFILTLNSDAGWMTPFCIKFWTGAPSQAFFVGWDGTTYTHCSYDPSEPTKLVVQFDDHHLPIGDLKFQIAYHFTVADFPNDTEDEVINPANITTEIDGHEYQVMLDFTGETAPEIQFSLPAYANEAQRIANEQQRIANEEQRISDEQTRIDNEALRISAEQTRQDNEEQRIRNEQTRINQEEARVREFATLKHDAQEATTAANDAAALANAKAALANDKAQLAADKAALAQDAANLANQKAQLAADKAALANDAAELANQKAQLAQQKAEYAKDQGDYAKQQGDYAKEQGDYAKRKGDDAAAQMQQQAQAFIEAQAARQTAYEQAEGTESGSVAGDGSRWGAFKTNEAARDAKVDAKVADITNLQEAVAEGAVYDISANNSGTTYADLTAALGPSGANVPADLRKGGMSVKFVQSSDNKYVQYRYMGTETTGSPNPFLNTANWQSMNVDDEPTDESNNLVKSGGIYTWVMGLIATIKSWAEGLFAKMDGYYESMTVGRADNLIGEPIPVTTGYILKATGYDPTQPELEFADGPVKMTEIRGRVCAWNQLYNDSIPTAISGRKYYIREVVDGVANKSVGTTIQYTEGSSDRMCIDVTLLNPTLASKANLTAAVVEEYLASIKTPKPYYNYNAGTLLGARMMGWQLRKTPNLLNPTTKQAKLSEHAYTGHDNEYTVTGFGGLTNAALQFTPYNTGVAEAVTLDANNRFVIPSSGVLEVVEATQGTAITGDVSRVCVVATYDGSMDGEIVAFEEDDVQIDSANIYYDKNGTMTQVFQDGIMRSTGESDSDVHDRVYFDNISKKWMAARVVRAVALRDVNISYSSQYEFFVINVQGKKTNTNNTMPVVCCSKYGRGVTLYDQNVKGGQDKVIRGYSSATTFIIRDSNYDNAGTFKAANGNVYLFYENKTPAFYDTLYYKVGEEYVPMEQVFPDGIQGLCCNWASENLVEQEEDANGQPQSITPITTEVFQSDMKELLKTVGDTYISKEQAKDSFDNLLTQLNANSGTALGGTYATDGFNDDGTIKFAFTAANPTT